MRPPTVTLASMASIVAIGLVAACGESDDGAEVVGPDTPLAALETTRLPSYKCRRAPRAAVATIALGLRRGGWLTGAGFVEVPASERSAQEWPAWFVAAEVGRTVGVWATGGQGDGPIMAIDYVSATSTIWGAGAQPTSQAWKLHARPCDARRRGGRGLRSLLRPGGARRPARGRDAEIRRRGASVGPADHRG